MRASDLEKILKRRGCQITPGKGAHVKVMCGKCATILSMHRGDIPNGTFRSIVKALEPCLGKGWEKE